ncbi:hypothetical protein HGRIS_003316 [Hohenbuehelia grisea]|uniref:Uncharacterized protein n=1 Tax=Hohenbuehelia grisea TaxID=104357 RepID=A0ABR3JF00_9AGAR
MNVPGEWATYGDAPLCENAMLGVPSPASIRGQGGWDEEDEGGGSKLRRWGLRIGRAAKIQGQLIWKIPRSPSCHLETNISVHSSPNQPILPTSISIATPNSPIPQTRPPIPLQSPLAN